MKPASEAYNRKITSGSSLVATCGICGRTHFATGPGALDYKEGERERLIDNAKRQPDRYINHCDKDSITLGKLSNIQVVIHCPCELVGLFEELENQTEAVIERIKQELDRMHQEVIDKYMIKMPKFNPERSSE